MFLLLYVFLLSCANSEDDKDRASSTLVYNGPPVISMLLGETFQSSLDITHAAQYTINGLPDWVKLNTETGELTLVPTELGHGIFDVTGKNDKGARTFPDALRISVYPDSGTLDAVIDALSTEPLEELVPTPGAIAHTNPQFFRNPDGTTWTACFAYYPGYDYNQQIITVDLNTGQVGVNDSVTFKDESWHQFKAVPGPGNLSYINPKGDGLIRVHSYDTGIHTWNYDVAGTFAEHGGSAQPSKIAVGANGRIYSLGRDPLTGDFSVLEVDPHNDDSTRFYSGITATGDLVAVAADNTHAYVVDNPYGTRYVTAVDLATDEREVLYSNSGITVVQRKYGVLLKEGSGYRGWLYAGKLIELPTGSTLNDSPPWGFDDTDLYEPSCYYDIPAPIADYDTTAMVPANSQTGYFWYIDPNGSPGTYIPAAIPDIIKYPETVRVLSALPNGNILLAAGGYNGYGVYYPQTNSITKYITALSNISNYAVTHGDTYAYISGYFGAPLLRYEFDLPWTNKVSDTYDPNETSHFDNPKYIGPVGNSYNIGKAFSAAVGSDGKAYVAGERVRSGIGGGVAIYDPVSDEVTGITEGFETTNLRNIVSAGKYIITSGYSETDTEPISIAVINTQDGSIERIVQPASDICRNAGRLAGSHTDVPVVYMLTESDDELSTRIIKMNVETGNILYDRCYDYRNDAGGYNDNGLSDILFAEDGFLYATIDTHTLLIRIDALTGYIEPIRRLSVQGGRFDSLNNNLYFAGKPSVRRLCNFMLEVGYYAPP